MAQKKQRRHRSKRWSKKAQERSDALDLSQGLFTKPPQIVADNLKKSAERSTRRKATAFQSAMSMLNFYINRAGKKISSVRKKRLNQAKEELRKLFGRRTVRIPNTKKPRQKR